MDKTKNIPTKNRKNSLDLLRIIAAFSVVIIHVNAYYFRDRSNEPVLDYLYITESFLNIVTRFSVPVFVMLSGAFLLQETKNKEFKYFYKKSIWKIGIPTLIVSVGLLLISEFWQMLTTRQYMEPIKGFLAGGIFNIWFMYMLGGLYLLTPFIIRIRETVSSKTYKVTTIFMLVWACTSQATSSFTLPYDMGVVFAFLSYFMAGDLIYTAAKGEKSCKIIWYSILIIILYVVTFVSRYNGISYYLFNAFTNFFSPTIMIASLLVFKIFVSMDIKRGFEKLSKYTFYIYLFHTLVYTVVFKLCGNLLPNNEIISILLVSIVTLLISLICAMVFDKVWQYIMLKCRTFVKKC